MGVHPIAAACFSLGVLAGCSSSGRDATVKAAPLLSATFPAAPRIVAIGDLHGDLAATRRALQLAGAIDAADHWVGTRLVVVQTGDELDRGDDEREIQLLLERLSQEASQNGGRLVLLNGNHELMNVAHDFRYVTPKGFEAFASFASGAHARAVGPGAANGRADAFAPGGPIARTLAQRPVVAAVGDTLFVHGGVLLEHVRYGLERINREVSAFMTGQALLPEALASPSSPVWTRVYSEGTPNAATCARLAEVLDELHMRRMVVGHTVQKEINSACDGRVWRIDVGMSRFYGGPTQVLEIQGSALRVLR